ncbi:MAG: hypothetical protein GX896_06285 [Clostridiales bacterium]|nr:hypothetical protein [Clostridiales bacterium]
MGQLGELFDGYSAEDDLRKNIETQLTDMGYLVNTDFKLVVSTVTKHDENGTIITGSVDIGSVNVGDTVEIKTEDAVLTASVSQITMFNMPFNEAVAGDNVSIIFDNIESSKISIGNVISKK